MNDLTPEQEKLKANAYKEVALAVANDLEHREGKSIAEAIRQGWRLADERGAEVERLQKELADARESYDRLCRAWPKEGEKA